VLSEDGVQRRRQAFARMSASSLVVRNSRVEIPACRAQVIGVDFDGKGVTPQNRALAGLAYLAAMNEGISLGMLNSALEKRFTSSHLAAARETLAKMNLVASPDL
jgi:hypothetical protein